MGNLVHGVVSEDSVSATSKDGPCTLVPQGFRATHQCAAGIDHVIHDQAGFVLDVTNHVHDLDDGGVFAALVDDGEGNRQPLRKSPCPLHAARVGRNHHYVFQLELAEIVHGDRCGEEVVHGNVEISLNLAGMKVQ